MVSGRLTVLPTSYRVAGCWFFEPSGLPGPGRLGLGARAGQGKFVRRLLNPRRTRAGVSRPGSAGFSQGRRRSAASGRARRSWVWAAVISQVHRSAASGVRELWAGPAQRLFDHREGSAWRPGGAVGEQEVGVLAGLGVEHLRLGGSGGLPRLDGFAQKRVDGFGERGAGLVGGDVQQADRVAGQDLARVLNVLGEDPFGDPHRPSEPRTELSTYPEAVVLTGLFTSPHWRDPPTSAEAARCLAIAPQQLSPGLAWKLLPRRGGEEGNSSVDPAL